MKIDFGRKVYWRKKSDRLYTFIFRASVVGVCCYYFNRRFGDQIDPNDHEDVSKKHLAWDWLVSKFAEAQTVGQFYAEYGFSEGVTVFRLSGFHKG